MNDRHQWEQATQHSRRLAIAADAELRRRHPGHRIEPLRSAEPTTVSDAQREQLILTPDKNIGEVTGWIKDLAAQRQAFREKLEERRTLTIPSEDPDREDLGHAFPSPTPPQQDTILQPPKPTITPSAKILELARDQYAAPEAAN